MKSKPVVTTVYLTVLAYFIKKALGIVPQGYSQVQHNGRVKTQTITYRWVD